MMTASRPDVGCTTRGVHLGVLQMRPKATTALSACAYCGEHFQTRRPSVKSLYCSVRCAARSRRNRIPRVCESCGNAFTTSRHHLDAGWGRFCSAECRRESMRLSVEQQLTAKLDRSGGPDACWPWTGSLRSNGYGMLCSRGQQISSHRASYQTYIGPIPDGMALDHTCRNRACGNPMHLEPVTNKVNVLRGVGPTAQNAAKSHCVNGHLFDEQNTRIDRGGKRACRTCQRERARARSRDQ